MITFLTTVMIFFFSLVATAEAADNLYFDVAVIGGGTGGSMAAVQAARMGMSVALIEQSDWVGGQMTGAAVSTIDDVRRTRTGLYYEFILKAKEYYDLRNTAVNVCLWGPDTFGFEPWAAQKALLDMIKMTGNVDLFLQAKVLKAGLTGGKVTSALIQCDGKDLSINAKIFIDATEAGDFIPMTGARYRSGNSASPKIDRTGVIQFITYPVVVKRYPNGVPEELKFTMRPPNYEQYLPGFQKIVIAGGDTWPGKPPYNIAAHNAYRGMPDVTNPEAAHISGGNSESWPYISRTAINWANDYPGHDSGEPGMSVRFLEDKKFRREAERKAMEKTLAFLYYMQTELKMEDWAIDNRQGYGQYFTNDWQDWAEMPKEFAPILQHFPPFPYIRESRRIAGVKTMTVKDVIRDPQLRRTLTSKHDSIALGEYPTDIHGLHEPQYLDKDLGEQSIGVPQESDWKGGLFQVPMGALIPEKIDGLLAAEKNISVSRIVNGSTRLQPITMLTGQAAGALAAVAIREKKNPRDVNPLDVQSALLDAKDKLSVYNFGDVPPESKWWKGVEMSVLYEYMDPSDETVYGVDDEMHWLELRDAFRRAFGLREFPTRPFEETVTLDDFGKWLAALTIKEPGRYDAVIKKYSGPAIMTKGQLAAAVADIMIMRANDDAQTKTKKK
ncbi:MAG: FAD-dependent oxidoreductase [Cloacibacillus sp.]